MSLFQRIVSERAGHATVPAPETGVSGRQLERNSIMRILVADDHGLVRETIAAFLVNEGFPDVQTVASLDEAVAAVKKTGAFDLVLLDYNMPGMNGLAGLEAMALANGGKSVALMSGTATPEIAEEAIANGAAGFVPKTLGSKSMVAAVRFMLAGEIYAPFAFLNQERGPTNSVLSPRELEMVKGICEGKSNKEIARDHDLQEVTVKLHVKTMSRKLGAKNRTHAAMIAKSMGLC
jgi:two-component system, NarL family, nitrate/nitrite response regulator NarL